jgi:hypothetical protein
MSPAEVIAELNRIGGANGVGRADIVENRYVGMKSRGCYETPGGTIMLKAHRAMESLTLDREAAHLKDELMPRYAELIYNGYWFSPERQMLQAAIDQTQTSSTASCASSCTRATCWSSGASPRTACSTSPSPPSRRTPAPTIRATRPASSAQRACALRRRRPVGHRCRLSPAPRVPGSGVPGPRGALAKRRHLGPVPLPGYPLGQRHAHPGL